MLSSGTSRNKPKLCYMGYYYNQERDYLTKWVWRCERRGSEKFLKCPGRCFSFAIGPPEIRKEHNHLPVPEKAIGLDSMYHMMENANISNDRPRTLIKRHQADIPPESFSSLVRARNICQRIGRIRGDLVSRIPNAPTRDLICIPDGLKVIK